MGNKPAVAVAAADLHTLINLVAQLETGRVHYHRELNWQEFHYVCFLQGWSMELLFSMSKQAEILVDFGEANEFGAHNSLVVPPTVRLINY